MSKRLGVMAIAIALLLTLGPVQAIARVSLGSASCFAVLSTGPGATLALNGAATLIRGQIGLGPSAVQNFTQGQIVGQLLVDPSATNSRANTVAIAGGTLTSALALPTSDAAAAAAAIAAMKPTQQFGPIGSSMVITGNGGVNVIAIAGIALRGASRLTLSGSETDRFYIQMTAGVHLSEASRIVLAGVPAANVIVNLGAFSLHMSAGSDAAGTLLAFGPARNPPAPISISQSTLNGAILARSRIIELADGAAVTPSCIAPSDIDAIAAPPGQWSFASFWDAFCANGATTGLGVNLAPGSPDLLIYLEPGGACFDYQSCYVAKEASNMASGYGPAQFQADQFLLDLPGGFFDRTSQTNPFKTYNYVYVPYCTGDVHAGRNARLLGPPSATRETLFFGGNNLDAYLARLVAAVPGVQHVVLAGSSAGGFGAILNWGAAQKAFSSAQVDMIDDSGTFMPASQGLGALQLAEGAWNLPAAIPSGCAACAGAGLANLYAYYADLFPQDRGALLSYQRDSVLPAYFGITEAQFTAGLDKVLRKDFEPTANLRYFVDDAKGHVLWFAPQLSSDHVTVSTFISQMVSGGTWSNAGPTP